ncbi:Phosphatidylcholine-sterol acyltransferase precursor [Planctomycetes bacterium MalM25]|nr:Phosphatidylcholine-sterol acyltransferase precursor [Planctomycetes bacterium MalM25]
MKPFIPLLLLATTCHASPYSDLFVFGDSLSDLGNTNAWTLGVAPGTNYYQGRFSNGPVYAERLSEGLGLGTLTRDGVGGDNFAYGGAETDGPGGFEGLFLNSLVEQIDAYFDRLDGAAPDREALFVVWIGANDFLRGGQTDASIPAAEVQTQLERLTSAGVTNLLGVNLPLLGLTPEYNTNPPAANAISALASTYNDELAEVYDELEASYPGLALHRLDVETIFSELLGDAGTLGFVNTSQAGRDASGGSLDGAPGYVFWDGVHPTREAHALLGEAAIRAVLPTGDFDRDGVLATEDYTAWRDDYGVAFNAALGQTPSLAADANGDGRVDAADYTVWRDALVSLPVTVPEPTTAGLVSLAALWALAAPPRGVGRRLITA